jgi:hypothetical protein
MDDKEFDLLKEGEKTMEEKILHVLQEIKEELQGIRSALEPKAINVEFFPEDSDGIRDSLGSISTVFQSTNHE